jgi:hypothetical protein
MADIFRESRAQTDRDRRQVEELRNYVKESGTDDFNKFDNFTKFVQSTTISRFLGRYEVFKLQLNVPGCIFDLGVGRGASLMTWAHLSSILEPVNYTREIVGFDTFEGCASLDPKDFSGTSSLVKQGGFAVEDDAFGDIERAISIHNLNRPLNHLPKVHLVKGDICQTLPEYLVSNPHTLISLLHLDTDLYQPTKTALEAALPRMPSGAIILFDELNNRFYPGETIAVLESRLLGRFQLKRFPWATTLSYATIL